MIVKSLDTLNIVSEEFTGSEEDLNVLVANLEFELKAKSKDGVGLSAIQIGVPQRVAIIRLNHKIKFHGITREVKESYNLYNAEILSQSSPFVFKGEGCLSFPGELYDTNRYNEITIKNGDGKEYKFSGFVAVAVQHEISHWNGKTIHDYKV